MKPKIALLTIYPADFTTFTGGVETATAGLLEGLREYQSDFEFHVVSTPKGLAQDVRIERDGFYFHFLSLPSIPLARPRLPFRVLKCLKELKKISPDLVHCQENGELALASVLGNYKGIITVHGISRNEVKTLRGWERYAKIAISITQIYLYRKFQDFICISNYTRSAIGKNKNMIPIPNPVRSVFLNICRKVSYENICRIIRTW
jgi:glycosyltransferase involved in cell wall biosynthesis